MGALPSVFPKGFLRASLEARRKCCPFLFLPCKPSEEGMRGSETMTGDQKKRFCELFTEYAKTGRALKPENMKRMDDAFACARAYARAKNTIDVKAVREFVMPVSNKIATVTGAPDAMWARWHIQRTEAVFIPLLKEMFGVAASCDCISRVQFCDWRRKFFHAADYNANQTFNRLVVACFPKQFCSVVAPTRLQAAIGKLNGKGLMAPVAVKMRSDGAWFDLCEAIVPIIKEGLLNYDLASQVSFIAAIADGGPRE